MNRETIRQLREKVEGLERWTPGCGCGFDKEVPMLNVSCGEYFNAAEVLALLQDPPDTGKEPRCPLGYCPICGARGVRREKRINGNDTCENGHEYKSTTAVEGAAKEPRFAVDEKEDHIHAQVLDTRSKVVT